jgi:cytochrome P450
LIHSWEGAVKIDNVAIITHPDDAERICKKHVKKAPIFKSFLYDSIISTTDNDDWKTQRSDMNMAFISSLSLKRVFPTSLERANHCCEILKEYEHSLAYASRVYACG